mmetsp:Transcript_61094/g.170904  ORF Transcript_61094/g.170904 Transcript_61094/m.170904 type:complete len:237 (-) Transcript_61094:758-1468(-)
MLPLPLLFLQQFRLHFGDQIGRGLAHGHSCHALVAPLETRQSLHAACLCEVPQHLRNHEATARKRRERLERPPRTRLVEFVPEVESGLVVRRSMPTAVNVRLVSALRGPLQDSPVAQLNIFTRLFFEDMVNEIESAFVGQGDRKQGFGFLRGLRLVFHRVLGRRVLQHADSEGQGLRWLSIGATKIHRQRDVLESQRRVQSLAFECFRQLQRLRNALAVLEKGNGEGVGCTLDEVQ